MENESSFQFLGYKVLKSFIEIKNSKTKELTINFEPSGIINKPKGSFFLNLVVYIFDDQKNINIEVAIKGEFSFKDGDEHLKNFMLVNAPALLFPYIRSYITALTALSGVPAVTLPTMNLTGLSKKLSDNIVEKH